MNITILCGHPSSAYAREVLRALNAHGLVRISVVAAAEPAATRGWKEIWDSYGWRLPRMIARYMARSIAVRITKLFDHEAQRVESLEALVQAQGGRFFCVPVINSEACRHALCALNTDLMILAGAPIVRKPVLEIPRLGVLNAHQGALPRFRGMNVIEWAILERTQPMLSIHFVDPGVDTGDIIATESVPLFPGDTLNDVRSRASARQPELLAHITNVALAGPLPRRLQRPEEGRQYFTMHPWLRAVAEQRLREHVCKLAQEEVQVHGGNGAAKTTRGNSKLHSG